MAAERSLRPKRVLDRDSADAQRSARAAAQVLPIGLRGVRSVSLKICVDLVLLGYMLDLVMANRAGSLIAAARVKTQLSQARLAELAGTTQPTISAYERGAKVPDLATLERILRAAGFELRMSLAELDDHDSSLERYERTLPAVTRKRFADRQHARKAGATRGGR